MNAVIVRSDTAITLVGGAPLDAVDLQLALSHAPILVAADGGAGAVLAAGLRPEAVFGDMDSLPDDARKAFADVLHPVTEQDTTDFDKTLRHAIAPLVIAVGVTGGRFDHELAVMHGLVRHPDRRCIVLGAESLVFLCPPDLHIAPDTGDVFSLFPMGEVRITSEGLRWPTAGIGFAPDRTIGTSNEVTGPVRLSADAPLMLVILPRAMLGLVVQALQHSGRHWPKRDHGVQAEQ